MSATYLFSVRSFIFSEFVLIKSLQLSQHEAHLHTVLVHLTQWATCNVCTSLLSCPIQLIRMYCVPAKTSALRNGRHFNFSNSLISSKGLPLIKFKNYLFLLGMTVVLHDYLRLRYCRPSMLGANPSRLDIWLSLRCSVVSCLSGSSPSSWVSLFAAR